VRGIRFTLLPLAAALALGACQSAQEAMEGKVDYKSEKVVQPLEIPPDLTAPQGDNRYVVPESGPSSATFSGYQAGRRDPRAPGTTVLPMFDTVRLERAGNTRWLVVQEPAEKLWPRVREFWTENGFLLKIELPEAGVMETDWAENRAKIPQGVVRDLLGRVFDQLYTSSERDKFRTRLERTADGKGTEIYLSHRGMQEIYTSGRDPVSGSPGQTGWAPREPDPELEAEFLRRLMVRLGASGDQAKQMLATGAPAQRAEITKAAAGTEALQVLEPFDRAWRRVGLALDRVGFTVEDRDRSQGLYFVRYVDPETDGQQKEDKGWLSKLAFWKSGKADVNKAAQYRIYVKGDSDQSTVKILTREGGTDVSDTSKKILGLLFDQLK